MNYDKKSSKVIEMPGNRASKIWMLKGRKGRKSLLIGYAVSILFLAVLQLVTRCYIPRLIPLHIGVALSQEIMGMNRYDKPNGGTYVLNLAIPFSLDIQYILAGYCMPTHFFLAYIVCYFFCMRGFRDIGATIYEKPDLLQNEKIRRELVSRSLMGKIYILCFSGALNVVLYVFNWMGK
jgi:hypothetical protein